MATHSDAHSAADTNSDTAADFVAATRVFYDAIAEDYSAHFRSVGAGRPLERAVMAAYAEFVQESGVPGGEVADLEGVDILRFRSRRALGRRRGSGGNRCRSILMLRTAGECDGSENGQQ